MRNSLLVLTTALTITAAAQTSPEPPAKKLFENTCGSCHDLGTATGMRHDKAGWEAVIDSMAARGALGSDKDFADIAAYLTKYFGVVNVNSATAREIADMLEIPAAVSDAIVKQRPYKNLDDLKKVPGIDAKLLDARKDRIAYQ